MTQNYALFIQPFITNGTINGMCSRLKDNEIHIGKTGLKNANEFSKYSAGGPYPYLIRKTSKDGNINHAIGLRMNQSVKFMAPYKTNIIECHIRVHLADKHL